MGGGKTRARATFRAESIRGALLLAALGAGCALHDDPTIGAEPRSLQPSSEGARSGVTSATASDLEQFVRQVADDANLTWAKDFKRRDKPFTPARPAFYAAGSAPSCEGRGDDSCPRETAFFDLTLQQLASERFGAESKPFSKMSSRIVLPEPPTPRMGVSATGITSTVMLRLALCNDPS